MAELCDLQVHINGQQTFFLNEKIISKFSGKVRKIIKQEKRRTQIKNSGIEIDEFPGGPDGFELVTRFCYNNGTTTITVANVSVLHCCALFLGMTEKVSACNLLNQTETFLGGMFFWPRTDIITCLKSCESFFPYADSSGLVHKLMMSLLAKIAQNSNIFVSSSSSSSPDTSSPFCLSSTKSTTLEVLGIKNSSSGKSWWIDELTILPPMIIEKFVKTLGAYGTDNNSLVLTRFLLNYLKTTSQSKHGLMIKTYSKSEYAGLAETAAYGALFIGKSSFPCRGLFWVLRVVSAYGISRDCRTGLEKQIGSLLDQATLDDLLVSGHEGNSVYDVNLVVRLIRYFVHNYYDKQEYVQKIKKVGWLIDKYLGEIAPDQNLKISKFLGVAESLADFARDCFDGMYRAVDIYLESHPRLALEERSRLCRCVKYEKLSLKACKELAKNPRIPPRVAVEALIAQSRKTSDININNNNIINTGDALPYLKDNNNYNMINIADDNYKIISVKNDEMRLNLQRMHSRALELEKVRRKMKGQMSKMGKTNGTHMISSADAKALPRLC